MMDLQQASLSQWISAMSELQGRLSKVYWCRMELPGYSSWFSPSLWIIFCIFLFPGRHPVTVNCTVNWNKERRAINIIFTKPNLVPTTLIISSTTPQQCNSCKYSPVIVKSSKHLNIICFSLTDLILWRDGISVQTGPDTALCQLQ